MQIRSRMAILFSVVSTIPSGFAVYLISFTPVVDQVGTVIPKSVWISSPSLLPLLSLFDGHTWPGDFVFDSLMVLSNAAVFGFCGYLVASIAGKAKRLGQTKVLQPPVNR